REGARASALFQATHLAATAFPQPITTVLHRPFHNPRKHGPDFHWLTECVDLICTSRYTRPLSLISKGRKRRGQAEADLPAVQGETERGARIPQAQRHQGGPRGPQAASEQGSQAPGRPGGPEVAGPVRGAAFPKQARLLRRWQFVKVQEEGAKVAVDPLLALA